MFFVNVVLREAFQLQTQPFLLIQAIFARLFPKES